MRSAVTALLALFGAQLLLAIVVVPPWQMPDEPQHVLTARLIQAFGGDVPSVSATHGVGVRGYDVGRYYDAEERVLIESMARHRWWDHYGRPTPDPLPIALMDAPGSPGSVVGDYFGPLEGPRVYYRATASVFRSTGITELLPQMYTMRALSALFALLTIWCVWAGTERLLGPSPALVVTSLLALHPQFLLISASATPDALVNLAGAAVWWQAAVLLTSPVRPAGVALLWLSALAAFLIRRMGAPLLVIALGVSLAVFATWSLRGDRRRLAALTAAVIVPIGLGGVAVWMLRGDLERSFFWIPWEVLDVSAWTRTPEPAALPRWLNALFRSFWLEAGWLRYPSPDLWHAVTVGVGLVAAAGFVTRRAWQNARAAVLLAGAMFGLQMGVLLFYHFGYRGLGPQGRHLFPMMSAILCLIWVGWRSWFGAAWQPLAAVLLIGVAALLNITAWTLVILPAYA